LEYILFPSLRSREGLGMSYFYLVNRSLKLGSIWRFISA